MFVTSADTDLHQYHFTFPVKKTFKGFKANLSVFCVSNHMSFYFIHNTVGFLIEIQMSLEQTSLSTFQYKSFIKVFKKKFLLRQP